MTAFGVGVTSGEPETYHSSGPGRRIFPEYEAAKKLRDELWDKLRAMEVNDPNYLKVENEYFQAEIEVGRIYRSTIGLGR